MVTPKLSPNQGADHVGSLSSSGVAQQQGALRVSRKSGSFKSKKLWGLLGVLILMGVGYLIFDAVYDYTEIDWVKSTLDNEVMITFVGAELNLKVEATDRYGDKIKRVEFASNDGHVVAEDLAVRWVLPNKPGEYQITARAPSGKTVSKRVVVFKHPDQQLTGFVKSEIDSKKSLIDSDGDGIVDKDEQLIKTDKNKVDSDGDGIDDGNELHLGLNPLQAQTTEGVNDGLKNLDYSLLKNKIGVQINVRGRKNIAYSDVDLISGPSFQWPGLHSGIYALKLDGDAPRATVKLKYDVIIGNDKKVIDEDALGVYALDQDKLVFNQIKAQVDRAEKTVRFETDRSLTFALGDVKAQRQPSIGVNILLDNSLSMYSTKQIKDHRLAKKGATVGVSAGNDVAFRRVTLSSKLIDGLTGDYRFSVGQFAGRYQNLSSFSSDRAMLKSKIASIKYNLPKDSDSNGGTNIVDSLYGAVDSFKNQAVDSRFIVLLTDGEDTTGRLTSGQVNLLIDKAHRHKVAVCTIGLGKTDRKGLLKKLSVATGCDYFQAVNEQFLGEIFDKISSRVSVGFAYKDGKKQGIKEVDSGFDPNMDGFSFANFASSKSRAGVCFGMANFANLYYTRRLPNRMSGALFSEFMLREGGKVDFQSKLGYDLSGTELANFKIKLNDFELKTKAIRMAIRSLRKETRPADFWSSIHNGVLIINDKYKSVLKEADVGFFVTKLPNAVMIDGQSSDKVELPFINVDDHIKTGSLSQIEKQTINAIWRLFIMQLDDNTMSGFYFMIEPDKAYEVLIEELKAKSPVVFSVDGHAVNAISTIRDTKDPNRFLLAIYDNNYPNETRYIKAVRKKRGQVSKFLFENSYSYQFSYDGEGTGPATSVQKFVK